MKAVLLIVLICTARLICGNNYCNIQHNERFDCFPDKQANRHECLTRGCCWMPAYLSDGYMDVPYCYYGSGNFGYEVIHVVLKKTGIILDLKLSGPVVHFGNNSLRLKADIQFESKDRLRVKIFDPDNKRYEVPTPDPEVAKGEFELNYRVTYTRFPFGITVKRKDTGTVIFKTNVGGFIFSDQFIQISSLLPSHNIYGLGEHALPFKLNTHWKTLTLFSRDIAVPEGGFNLYGVHPFYLSLENDGKANGVFLKNSNAMDIILQPSPAITYRTIGGILDFYIFTGPTPADVVKQYTEVIGRPTLPPYWSLGFHLCRYGYNTIENMDIVRKRMALNKIPQDTQWTDIDYMSDYKDFTIDEKRFHGLPEFVDQLHKDGIHYVMIVDPAISNKKGYKTYENGVKDNVFIKDGSGEILIGKVWPGETAFPDFFHPNATSFWYNEIKTFHKKIKFDGLWIDMNEPSNFVQGSTKGCASNRFDDPPYVPAVLGGRLNDKTICMNAQQYLGKHYDLHSLYGHSEAVATNKALEKLMGKRSLVITRSSFSGTGSHAGHWLGDNHSTWRDLYLSISGILNFNLFGIPLVGADICGFLGDTDEELCSRWMQLGAFYPFSRNHNNLNQRDQDPAAFGKQLIKTSREALAVRYTLLPYLYTLFYEAHVSGSTVATPIFFEFPSDESTYDIDTQFMWGSALLISPVLTKGAKSVKAYFPFGNWYEYYTGTEVISNGGHYSLPASFEKVNLHIRGGYIIPIQEPALTTTKSRKNPFGLIVALDEKNMASGMLYVDDGESFVSDDSHTIIHFECANDRLVSFINTVGYIPENQILSHIRIVGFPRKPKHVLANGKLINPAYNQSTKVLEMTGLNLSIVKKMLVSWSV